MKSVVSFLLLVLLLASCAVSHTPHQQAPRKYREYYQHRQKKNARRRPFDSVVGTKCKGQTNLYK